jgi:rhomboid protease GluP
VVFGHKFIPFIRFPQVFPVTTSILLVQTVVFIMLVSTGQMHEQPIWVQYGAYIDWRIDEGEWWRLISPLFLHVSVLQYVYFSLTLYIFAPQLEWLVGRLLFLIFYLATGSMTYFGYYIFDISGVHTGAGGALFGVLGFYFYLYLRKLIDPRLGFALMVIVGINLLLDLDAFFVHLLAFLFGALLVGVLIEIRRWTTKEHEDE